MRYYYTPIRMAIINIKGEKISIGEGVVCVYRTVLWRRGNNMPLFELPDFL